MSAVQELADLIANAVRAAQNTVGMIERGTVSGTNVVTNNGVYAYDLTCPINVYEGKQVYGMVSDEGVFVIVGD